MTISKLISELTAMRQELGDVPVVLWDLDTSSYFALSRENLEPQLAANGFPRISIGVNGWDDPSVEGPKMRPLRIGKTSA